MPPPTFEHVASRLARTQHGVVSRQQLRAAGIGRDTIDHRLRSGRIRRIHRGVYLVGPVAPEKALEMAACLACGPWAALSHRSAGRLWRLLGSLSRPVEPEVAVSHGYRRRPGIRIRHLGTLRPDEVTRFEGIPITTPVRTLYDMAAVLRPRALERAVAEALALRLASVDAIVSMARLRAGRPGAAHLLAATTGDAPARTNSEAEERFLDLVRRGSLPHPRVNATLAGWEVDFYWPKRRVAVEVDGAAYHRSKQAFERDHRRNADLAALGVHLVRVTWAQITSGRETLLAQLGALLLRED